MWQNIQKVFRKKTSKSPDPKSNIAASANSRQQRPSQTDFKINVLDANARTWNGPEGV